MMLSSFSFRGNFFVVLLALASFSIPLILPSNAPAKTKSRKIVIGPGGRPLRTSYPGTPNSLRASTIGKENLHSEEEAKIKHALNDRQRLVNYSELRNRIRENKTRIALMNEALLFNGTQKPRLYVRFENKLPQKMTLEQLDLFVDQAPQPFIPGPSPDFSSKLPLPLFYQDVTPGLHTLAFTALTANQAMKEGEGQSGKSLYISGDCSFSIPAGMNAFLLIVATYSTEAQQPVISCQLNVRPVPPAKPQSLSNISAQAETITPPTPSP